jgi:hypothetical protein
MKPLPPIDMLVTDDRQNAPAACLNFSLGIEGRWSWEDLSKPHNWMKTSKALSSPANRNPRIGETFLVRKWLDPPTELRIDRIDEDVICQQALNDGAAMLIVG